MQNKLATNVLALRKGEEPKKILHVQIELLRALGLNPEEIIAVSELTTAYAIAHIQELSRAIGK